jgi:hypothetical protein
VPLLFAHQRLDLLGEGFFDGVEIGRVWRQVKQLAASLLDELPDPPTLLRREVVHHHNLSWVEREGANSRSR